MGIWETIRKGVGSAGLWACVALLAFLVWKLETSLASIQHEARGAVGHMGGWVLPASMGQFS